MKRAVTAILFLAVLGLAACGGNSNSSPNPNLPPSQLTRRALLTNEFAGAVQILDAQNDFGVANSVSLLSQPTRIFLSPDKKFAAIVSPNSISSLNVTTEAAVLGIPLPNWTESLVVMSGGAKGYAAVRNSNAVLYVDLADTATANSTLATITVPLARRLVPTSSRSKILVFSDESDSITVLNTSDNTITTVAGFDRPVTAVMSADDSKAYILSCGAECGGTSANVRVLTLSDNSLSAAVPVTAATIGLLDGTRLYVAGTKGAAGALDVIDTGNLTVNKSNVTITGGYHDSIALQKGKLFIGARACTPANGGCLSVFDTSAQTATNADFKGEVTGMDAIPGRDVVYVIAGGELVIYDANTGKPQSRQVIILGKASDVKALE